MKKSVRIPLAVRIASLSSLLILAVTIVLSYLSLNSGYQSLEQRFGLVLKHITINTALQLEGKTHKQITKPTDSKSAAFSQLEKKLRKVMISNYLSPETLYTFNIDSTGGFRFAIMLQEKKFIGDVYNPPIQNLPYFMRVKNGESVFTGIYNDDHGAWISGLSPIKDGNKVIGIAEADFRVEEFLNQLRSQTITILKYAAVILLISVMLSVAMARRLTHPIRRLKNAAVLLAKGESDIAIHITNRDEIGDLQKAFMSMVKAVNERLQMLKYLSPHTRRMIENEISNPTARKGEVRTLVLLITDIRGFTKFSEHRDPREVIENLNSILGKQADIIEQFGGDIDKFVGDQIIAIFEGNSIGAGLALKSALSISSMIRKNRESLEFNPELDVGIGITMGEVVMGSIGSSGRQDFTVIGSNVNLAARICAAARSSEILMTSHVYYSLLEQQSKTGPDTYDLKKKGQLKAKGFSVPIPVYACEGI